MVTADLQPEFVAPSTNANLHHITVGTESNQNPFTPLHPSLAATAQRAQPWHPSLPLCHEAVDSPLMDLYGSATIFITRTRLHHLQQWNNHRSSTTFSQPKCERNPSLERENTLPRVRLLLDSQRVKVGQLVKLWSIL